MDQIWSTWLLVQNCSVRQSALEGCIILITLLIFVSNVLFWSQCRCKILDYSQVSQETVHPRIHPVWETQEPLMRRFSNRPEPRDTTKRQWWCDKLAWKQIWHSLKGYFSMQQPAWICLMFSYVFLESSFNLLAPVFWSFNVDIMRCGFEVNVLRAVFFR